MTSAPPPVDPAAPGPYGAQHGAGAPPYGSRAPAPWQPRRAYRDTVRPLVGGVTGGLAQHLGVPQLWVRVFFVVTALLSGFGIALYAGLWIFLPAGPGPDHAPPGLASATRGDRRPRPKEALVDAGPAIAFGVLIFGLVLLVQGVLGGGALLLPAALGVAGLALLWRQADEVQRERWIDASGRIDPFRAVFGSGGWASYTRVAVGLGLVVVGLTVVALTTGPLDNALPVLLATLLGIGGLALVVGPWALRLVNDLGAEREARVRSEERADVAAHLHDSVLQTLALIQKNSHDATKVARLARAQERDLRSWLFASEGADPATLAGALREAAARVEEDHPVTVDVVAVGDRPYDEQVRPVVEASREAVVNAAKHAGVERVDVYAEVSPGAVEVFVRDRGVGFDPDRVADDRRGVRGSIVDRMQRHGGTAVVRSSPGEGTEVRLRMPLTDQEESRG